MNTFLYVLLIFIAIVSVLAFIAPNSYDVSRTVMINKSIEEVYAYLKLLKNQDYWSPWSEKDPNMKKTLTGVDGEVGCISAWIGNKDVGEGEQEIMALKENKEIMSELRFLKPFKSTSDAYLSVSEEGSETKVVWGFSGTNKFPMSMIMLFMNIDKSVGGDFEQGLKKLKSVLES
jgi:hypothetical protein